MEKYKLEQPDLLKIAPKEMDKISQALVGPSKNEILNFVQRTTDEQYLHWDTFRFKRPIPQDVSIEGLWVITKIVRQSRRIVTPITDTKGNPFTWSKLSYFEEFFHDVDMNTGGELFVEKGGLTKANKQKLLTRGIMEEAIASSQLEGAATSRQAAKKMLQEGRKPSNESERMILNSYISMKTIEESYRNQVMSMGLLLELHTLITQDTLDSEGKTPRLRGKSDPVYISDRVSGVIYHEGPESDVVAKELEKLIAFANDEENGGSFIHPVVKAIMLHFWIGYLHPFTDGNGRLARMLFYWYLIRKGYWAFVYLPISKVIKKSPQQYTMAYVYSEQDENDLTYFVDYNMRKIKLAIRDFKEYLAIQAQKNTYMKKKSEGVHQLNNRQIHLLQHLHGDFDEYTTLTTHMNLNQVTKGTASRDLKDLENKGFLETKRHGRNVYHFGTRKINELFD